LFITLALKAILYFSGIFLFFRSVRPFKNLAIYYFIYFFTPLAFVLFYLIHGIFWGLINSFTLAPVFPISAEYRSNHLIVYQPFSGFLGACCTYEIKEPTLFLFERSLGEFKVEDVDNDYQQWHLNPTRDSIYTGESSIKLD